MVLEKAAKQKTGQVWHDVPPQRKQTHEKAVRESRCGFEVVFGLSIISPTGVFLAIQLSNRKLTLSTSSTSHHHNFIPREKVNMSASDALEDRKGSPIRLHGGTFKKHKEYVGAWLDTGKNSSKYYYHIIVEKPDLEDPDTTYLEIARALKTNCLEPDPAPQTYIQAAFQQVPQLRQRLTDFSKMVAKCRIRRGRELSDLIRESLDRETHTLMAKGSNAEYKIIDTTGLPDIVPPDFEDEANDV